MSGDSRLCFVDQLSDLLFRFPGVREKTAVPSLSGIICKVLYIDDQQNPRLERRATLNEGGNTDEFSELNGISVMSSCATNATKPLKTLRPLLLPH